MKKEYLNLIAHFDFEKVHEVMTSLNWEWAGSNGVPDIVEIKDHAIDIILRADEIQDQVESGGFIVFYDDEEKRVYKLLFSLTSWEI